MLQLNDNLRAFIAKLQNWKQRINLGNIAMFENLFDDVDGKMDEILKQKSLIIFKLLKTN